MRRRIFRELAVFALFVVLAIAMTWPLAGNLSTAVNDLGDPLLNAWILDWVCHALIHQPLTLYSAPVFHPAILPLAYSENLVAVAVLVLPLHVAGASPITLHNVAFLLGFALSGYGAFVLARMVSRSTAGALVGGIFFAFCAYKFDHLAHLQIIFSAWVPLLLAALLAFWEKPTWGRGALVTLAWVANGLTNIYFLMFVGVAAIFTVALLAIIRPRRWRFYAGLAAATAIAVLILLPFLLPYRTVSRHYRMVRSMEEVQNGSATWTNWLVPGRLNQMYGRVAADRVYAAEKQLFPGMLILLLTGAGLFLWRGNESSSLPVDEEPLGDPKTRRLVLLDATIVATLVMSWATMVAERVEIKVLGARILAADSSDIPLMAALVLTLIRFAIRLPRALGGVPLRVAAGRSRFNAGAWVAAVWIFVGVAGSFGVNGFLYTFFYQRFEPFQAMRVAARFAVIAYAGLAVWGAIGTAAIVNAQHGRKRVMAAALLLVLMIADVRPRILWERAPQHLPSVYAWMAKTKVGPVMEVPFSGEGVDYLYLLGSAKHRVPLVNGTSGFFPSEFWRMRDPDYNDDFDKTLAIAEEWGVRLLVVHGPLFKAERRARIVDFLKRHLATHRLEFLRHFENDVEGDFVFAVTRNLPQWRSLAAPETPDGAGFLPQHTLARFLAGERTHTDAVLVHMDTPLPWMTLQGPLRITGWTLSPFGVRRVTVHLHTGKRTYEARRVPRPDVQAEYPWLRYMNDLPGFELVLDERPRGIPMDTTVQVEVEDLAGRVRRGRDTFVKWEQ